MNVICSQKKNDDVLEKIKAISNTKGIRRLLDAFGAGNESRIVVSCHFFYYVCSLFVLL